MKKALLLILWLILSAILPACSMTPEERALAAEDREYQRRQEQAREAACVASGNIYMSGSSSCISQEDFRRWIDYNLPN